MERLAVAATPLPGLVVLERRVLQDARGGFSRLYGRDELDALGVGTFDVAQANHSVTAHVGALRGLHYQRDPHAERKLVHCVRGAVFDVAVDLRRGSPTFGRWHGELLSATNGRAMLIPERWAHGFQCLEADSEVIYLHTAAYAPDSEGGVDALDPALAVGWPLPPGERSKRDGALPRLGRDFEGL